MWRLILIAWSGAGREVAGLPAEVVEVRWEDFSTWSAGREAREGELAKAIGSGYTLFMPDYLARGVGEDFRAVEVFLVHSGSGWTMGQLVALDNVVESVGP